MVNVVPEAVPIVAKPSLVESSEHTTINLLVSNLQIPNALLPSFAAAL